MSDDYELSAWLGKWCGRIFAYALITALIWWMRH